MRKWAIAAVLAAMGANASVAAQDLAEAERRLEEARQAVRDMDSTGMPENIKQGWRDLVSEAEADLARLKAEQAAADNAPAAPPAPEPTPAPPAEEALPSELGAGLPALFSVPLTPANGENAFVQVNTQVFLCGDDIVLSYSLHPVPERNIRSIRFSGTVSGPGGAIYPFEVADARVEPGDALGCGHQTVRLAALAQHEKDLIQHTYTDGTKVWNRKDMVVHMLGQFHTRPAPAPWPREANAAAAERDAAAARQAEVDQQAMDEFAAKAKAQSDAIAADNVRRQQDYEAELAKTRAAQAQYARDVAAHQAAVAQADAERAEYQRRLAEYEAALGKARVKPTKR